MSNPNVTYTNVTSYSYTKVDTSPLALVRETTVHAGLGRQFDTSGVWSNGSQLSEPASKLVHETKWNTSFCVSKP